MTLSKKTICRGGDRDCDLSHVRAASRREGKRFSSSTASLPLKAA
ncbi:hypothetical protein [Nostoc sp.]